MAARKKVAAKKKVPAKRKVAAAKKPVAKKPVAKKKPAAGKSGAASRAAALAGIGSEAVKRATGRALDAWLDVLDRAGAKAMSHRDIARLLAAKFGVPSWWSQMVAVGYEQARGLRLPNQNARGFSATASRTVAAAADRVYEAWVDAVQRAKWLPSAPVAIRRANDGRSLRITWTIGGSSVEVGFFPKGPGKSQVQVEHGKLADATAATEQKVYWAAALDRLKAMVEARK